MCALERIQFSDPIGGFGLGFGHHSMHRMSSRLCSLLNKNLLRHFWERTSIISSSTDQYSGSREEYTTLLASRTGLAELAEIDDQRSTQRSFNPGDVYTR